MNHKDYYNGELADQYYRIAEETNAQFRASPHSALLRGFIPQGASVCELGCGAGGKLDLLKDIAGSLMGVDISREGIAHAKNLYPDIDFRVGDIEQTGLASASFDVVTSFFVLEHTEDPTRTIAEMLRIVRTGGTIILWLPNYGSPLFPSPPTLHGLSIPAKILCILRRLISFGVGTSFFAHVDPIRDRFDPDYDTVSEIRMDRLRRYLRDTCRTEIRYESSCWESMGTSLLFRLYLPFKWLSWMAPFRYMGPQCFIVLQKL